MHRSASRGIKLSSVAFAVAVLAVSAWFNQAAAQNIEPDVVSYQTK
ncbi:hypothetical protein PULV_a0188 [Pseudoalteromonas ulvae UL12]|nr:hypothetical protein [Pseudoalteromonas ulvae]MBE0362653.1 hypothetical protein [Pseudoalteromonas ulvae UL12]